MATVIGKTSERIDELLSTLFAGVITFVEITPERNLLVKLSDGSILNLGPVGVDPAVFDAALETLHARLVANDVALAELDDALTTLNEETLPGLNTALAANQVTVAELKDVTLPALQDGLEVNQAVVQQLRDVTIPELNTALEANVQAITVFNTTTLPALQSDLSSNQSAVTQVVDVTIPALREDLQEASIIVAQLEAQQIALSTEAGNTSDLVNLIQTYSRLEHKVY